MCVSLDDAPWKNPIPKEKTHKEAETMPAPAEDVRKTVLINYAISHMAVASGVLLDLGYRELLGRMNRIIEDLEHSK